MDGAETEVPQHALGEFVGEGVRAVHPFGVQLIRMQTIMTCQHLKIHGTECYKLVVFYKIRWLYPWKRVP